MIVVRFADMAAALALVIMAGCASVATAATAPASEPEAAGHIRATLGARFPEVKIDAVRAAPIAGLYEVFTKGEMIYVDATAQYLLAGKLLSTADKRDLSAAAWDEYNRIDFATLPLDAAIRTVRGKGTRKLAVFSDPLCPYCRKLEQELASLEDVTIYTFLFPIEELHKGATARSRALWCATDRSAAWEGWMLQSREPAAADCPVDPVAANQSLADRLNVTVTPTLFFTDGTRATGSRAAADLDRLLQQRSNKSLAAR